MVSVMVIAIIIIVNPSPGVTPDGMDFTADDFTVTLEDNPVPLGSFPLIQAELPEDGGELQDKDFRTSYKRIE